MNNLFITAAEIAQYIGKSKAYGYKIVRILNQELTKKGYLVVEGQTNRQYFYDRYFGLAKEGVDKDTGLQR